MGFFPSWVSQPVNAVANAVTHPEQAIKAGLADPVRGALALGTMGSSELAINALQGAGVGAKKGPGAAIEGPVPTSQANQANLYGSGTGGLTLTGSTQQQQGAAQGLQFGQMLYGQGIGDVGNEAADYAARVKGNLGRNYAGADVARQSGQQRISQANAKAGLSGVDTTGISEQARRRASMEASMANQDYKDKAVALYGKNVGAKQQGLAGQYMAGAGFGQASTPGAVANVSSRGVFDSLICTELKRQGKMSHYEWIKASCYGATLDKETYNGYLTIARPIVQLMKRSDKFSNLFIGWSKSIARQKPNLLTKILLPLCWMVGNAKRITKKETISFS